MVRKKNSQESPGTEAANRKKKQKTKNLIQNKVLVLFCLGLKGIYPT